MAYAPPGSTTQTPSLAHLASVYYDRTALTQLMARFYFAQCCNDKPMPLNSGKTIQFYRVGLPAFNTAPAAEGYIPDPVPEASTTIRATVEEYSDFMSTSTLLKETDISDVQTRMVEELSYRGAGSVDTIIRQEIDSNTSALYPTAGNNISAIDFRAQNARLRGINARPFADGYLRGVIHPFITYDLTVDNTAGGFIDLMKYSAGPAVMDGTKFSAFNGEVGMVGGVRLMESTNVSVTGSSPSALYNTYIFANEAVGIVDLAGKGPSRVTDPMNERFRVNIVPGGPSLADPTGTIGGIVSYRYVFAAKTLDPNRIRIIQADASLV